MILHTDASGTDATPLTLTITSPTDGTTVSTSTISVTGTATDATGNSATEIVTITASLPNLVFAINPNSRLAQVGTPVTIFMSVINAGTGSVTDVSILQASGLPATTSYQAWNSVTLIGTPDTPVDIGSGETVDFVLTINPTTEFVSSAMTFDVPVPIVNLPTFAFFLTPSELISFDPANNRIMLKLVDGNGKLVGAQSVAISTI